MKYQPGDKVRYNNLTAEVLEVNGDELVVNILDYEGDGSIERPFMTSTKTTIKAADATPV